MVANPTYLIAHPELFSRETLYELRVLLARYPYCQTLRLLFLRNLYLLHDISFGEELKKGVLYAGDRRVLFYLIEGDKYVPLPYQKTALEDGAELEKEPGINRTLFLIDSFLAEMPSEGETVQTDNLPYISDYSSFLEQENLSNVGKEESPVGQPKLRGQELIDSFIVKAETESVLPAPKMVRETEPAEEYEADHYDATLPGEDDDETCFTETLAKIYIRQHRYSKALEIIKKLSLKYPKKNVYFADQIRFLEKLIINAKSE